MGIQLADAQRVAVGCRACGSPNADAASSTCNILDDHGLTKGYPHALADDASDGIRGPTCRKWDDYCNGSGWKALCTRDVRQGGQNCSTCCQMQKRSAGNFHLVLPLGCLVIG